MNAIATLNTQNPALSELSHDLWELFQDYQELASMIPADEPGSRTLPRLNQDLMRLTIQFMKLADKPAQAQDLEGAPNLVFGEAPSH